MNPRASALDFRSGDRTSRSPKSQQPSGNRARRHEREARISSDQAAQAHNDLLDLPIEHWPYELLAPRAWQLRHHLFSCDASYVALAELTSTTLVTLDRRLATAPGLHCRVRTP